MNIVLTGLRGSGKSKVGKIIAGKLAWDFVDTDEQIEQAENQSIADIVSLRGWEYFRARESEITKKIASLDKTVISTGGGLIIDRENEKNLKKNGRIIYLYVKPEICARRILDKPGRPALTNKESVEEEIEHLYKQRNGRYCESANLIFKRSDDPETDAEQIIKALFEP